MTDKPEDSGLPLGGQNANSAPSQPAGVQQSSQGGSLTAEQYRAIAREEAIKAAQQVKDRRFDGIEREQQAQRTLMDRIEEKLAKNPDMSYAEAKEKSQIDQLIESNSAPAAPASTGSRNDAPDVGVQVIESLGLDLNDTEVAQIHARNTGNVKAMGLELRGLLESRATAPQPNAAANAAPVTGVSVQDKSVEQLTADYKQEMRAATGNK